MFPLPNCQVYWGRATPSNRPCIRLPFLNKPPKVERPPCIFNRPPPPRLTVLKIRKIDPCLTENGREHHTDSYELMRSKDEYQLVVRRGQNFFLHIILERDYSSQSDGVSFVFQLEGIKMPNLGSNTEVVVPLKKVAEDQTPNVWSADVVRQGKNYIYVSIRPPSTCIIGEWKLQVDTKLRNEATGATFQYRKNIIILFNPWCKSDSVYLMCDPERNEFVLNEKGIIYRGNHKSIYSSPWYFGQFQKNVLKCALMLFSEVSPVQPVYRHDPVHITRSLSAALNSEDDNGVLVMWHGGENSDDPQQTGTDPQCWAGSVKILCKYYKSKQPVKYGHCWVFAGICTTVCRALGIPCRPVTVYQCAHDNDGNLLVDVYVDEKCQLMKTGDAVWEYHVFNEVWIKRPDLSSEYDGWNVIDVTPMKRSTSTNIYQCGPASVNAIKNGEILKAHDTQYLYASVNADLVYWKFTGEDRPLKLIKTVIDNIGCKIVTKFYENNEVADITENYKIQKGSTEERTIMERALRECGNSISRIYVNTQFKKIIVKLDVSDESPMIGSPFEAIVTIRNTDQQNSYKVDTTVALELLSNTYADMDPLKSEHFIPLIGPQQEFRNSMRVTYDDYKHYNLKEEEYFRVGCSFCINCIDYDYVEFKVVQLRKPTLSITVRQLTQQDSMICSQLPNGTTTGQINNGSNQGKQPKPPSYGSTSCPTCGRPMQYPPSYGSTSCPTCGRPMQYPPSYGSTSCPTCGKPMQYPQLNPPSQNPQLIPPSQNPQLNPPSQCPQLNPPSQNPQLNPPSQNPQLNPPSQNPQLNPPSQNPQLNPPLQNPPSQNPQLNPPSQNPQLNPPSQNPQLNPPSQKPQLNPPSQNPQLNPPSQNPQLNPPSQNPQLNPPSQNPQLNPPLQNPPSQNPQLNPPSQNPQLNPPSQNPQLNPPSQNPQLNPPSQYPQLNPPLQNPQLNPPSQNPQLNPPLQNTQLNLPLQNPQLNTQPYGTKVIHGGPMQDSQHNTQSWPQNSGNTIQNSQPGTQLWTQHPTQMQQSQQGIQEQQSQQQQQQLWEQEKQQPATQDQQEPQHSRQLQQDQQDSQQEQYPRQQQWNQQEQQPVTQMQQQEDQQESLHPIQMQENQSQVQSSRQQSMQWVQQEQQPARQSYIHQDQQELQSLRHQQQQEWGQQEDQSLRQRQQQQELLDEQPAKQRQQEFGQNQHPQWEQQQSRTPAGQQTLTSQIQEDQQHQQACVSAGLVFEVVATLTNPLPVKLTNGCFRFEGAENLIKTSTDGVVQPNGTISGSCRWKLMSPGKYSVTGTFTSNELEDVHGSCDFTVP